MAKTRNFKTPKDLADAWKRYKDYCDNECKMITHGFSSTNSQFVSKELHRVITYTIIGFCVYCDISRAAFYDTYRDKPGYSDIVTRMEEECEYDARRKFEMQAIPSQLAGLWMSKHGYSVKSDAKVSGAVPVVISGEEKLED